MGEIIYGPNHLEYLENIMKETRSDTAMIMDEIKIELSLSPNGSELLDSLLKELNAKVFGVPNVQPMGKLSSWFWCNVDKLYALIPSISIVVFTIVGAVLVIMTF